MRRDLQLDCDPAELVLNPPDRSRLKEMFRQYEFRNLLQRVDVIDEALPAAPMKLEGVAVPWREGEVSPPSGEAGIAVEDGRVAHRPGGGRRRRVDAGDRRPRFARPTSSRMTPSRSGSTSSTTRCSWRT